MVKDVDSYIRHTYKSALAQLNGATTHVPVIKDQRAWINYSEQGRKTCLKKMYKDFAAQLENEAMDQTIKFKSPSLTN